jgi:predicted nucleotide-binding protein
MTRGKKSTRKWRRYQDEDGDSQVFRVFISHGRSALRSRVKRFVEEELSFATEVLVDRFSGAVIFDKLEDDAWDCDCAIVIMTPDDPQPGGMTFRARQNVVHEIGYLQGMFRDRELVVILKEDTVESFSNVHGLEYIGFSGAKIASVFPKLRQALEDIYEWYASDEED